MYDTCTGCMGYNSLEEEGVGIRLRDSVEVLPVMWVLLIHRYFASTASSEDRSSQLLVDLLLEGYGHIQLVRISFTITNNMHFFYERGIISIVNHRRTEQKASDARRSLIKAQWPAVSTRARSGHPVPVSEINYPPAVRVSRKEPQQWWRSPPFP